jgi:hypothetical protein
MRAALRLPLLAVLALVALATAGSGCVVAAPRPPPPSRPPPPVVSPERPGITREEAVDVAFRVARDRGLRVDRVDHAHRDGAGRWHVEVSGRGDRAKLLIDARDGRLLRGRFRTKDRDGRFDVE